jgi:hypothetical protein
VFHDVPADANGFAVPRIALLGPLRTVLIPRRPLNLVDLTGWAHKRLKLPGRALVECEPPEYPITAEWGQRFHQLAKGPDGLYWRSRQYDRSFAIMLFGDRVAATDLEIVLDDTIALWQGEGYDEVLAAAEAAGIAITT